MCRTQCNVTLKLNLKSKIYSNQHFLFGKQYFLLRQNILLGTGTPVRVPLPPKVPYTTRTVRYAYPTLHYAAAPYSGGGLNLNASWWSQVGQVDAIDTVPPIHTHGCQLHFPFCISFLFLRLILSPKWDSTSFFLAWSLMMGTASLIWISSMKVFDLIRRPVPSWKEWIQFLSFLTR